MYKNKKTLAVITARGGSKGIPRKNIKFFDGKPLIAHTIIAAKKSKYLTRTIVSTDDQEIADISRQFGGEVPFIRPGELAQDESTSLAVVNHALCWLKQNNNEDYDYLMILQPTSPLRTAADIDACIIQAVDGQADSVMSMTKLDDFSPAKLKQIRGGLIHPYFENEGNYSARRQDLDKMYKRNCAIYLTKVELIKQNDLFGRTSLAYLMPPERSIDINQPIDFELAEFWLQRHKSRFMPKKVLVTIGSKFTPQAKEILNSIGQVDCLNLQPNELADKIGQYDILVVGLGLNINSDIINRATRLKIIATATTGLDHIDVKSAQKRGITVLSLRGEKEFLNTISGTAELTVGLMIDLMRQTHAASAEVKQYRWNREQWRGYNLFGKTLGIVGLGRLGKMIARYANAFGMKVIAYDPKLTAIDFKNHQVSAVSFNDLLRQSDIISIHAHLTSETKFMFNQTAFVQMKKTAYLINTARGAIVNEVDLLEALKNKKIAGYAADVLADELNFERNFSRHPLAEYAKQNHNLIITPHIGGMTHESREATDIFIAQSIIKYFR